MKTAESGTKVSQASAKTSFFGKKAEGSFFGSSAGGEQFFSGEQGAAVHEKEMIQRAPKTIPAIVPEPRPHRIAYDFEPLTEVYFAKDKGSIIDFFVFPRTTTTMVGLAKFLFKAADTGDDDADATADTKSPLATILQAFKIMNNMIADPVYERTSVHIGDMGLRFGFTDKANFLVKHTPLFRPDVIDPEDELKKMGVATITEFIEKKAKLDMQAKYDSVRLSKLIKSLLDAHPYGLGDPQEDIIAILRKYAAEPLTTQPQQYPNGGQYFDDILGYAEQNTGNVSTSMISDEVASLYTILLNHLSGGNKTMLLHLLKNYSVVYRGIQPGKEASAWSDIAAPALLRIPSGATKITECFIRGLPVPDMIKQPVADELEKINDNYLDHLFSDQPAENAMSMDIACTAGSTISDIAGIEFGGMWSLDDRVEKAKKIINALETADELYQTYKQVSGVIENLPKMLDLFSDSDKLFDILFGLTQDDTLSTVETWVLRADPLLHVKPDPKAKGLEKFKRALGEVVAFIKMVLKPVFEIRRWFLQFIEKAENALAGNPVVSLLIANLARGRQLVDLLQGDIPGNIIQMLHPLVEDIKGYAAGKVKDLELLLANSIAGVRAKITAAIAEFGIKKITDAIPELKGVMLFPYFREKVNNLISEKLIDPMLGKIGLDAVTQKINGLAEMVGGKVMNGVDFVLQHIETAVRTELKDVHLQLSLKDVPRRILVKVTGDLVKKAKTGVPEKQGEGQYSYASPEELIKAVEAASKKGVSGVQAGEEIRMPYKNSKAMAVILEVTKDTVVVSVDVKKKGAGPVKTPIPRHDFDYQVEHCIIIRVTKERQWLADNRPKFKPGLRRKVWDAACKRGNNVVRDPHSDRVLKWDSDWQMGHIPGKEYNKLVDCVMSGAINFKQFLDHYQNPDYYWPEGRSENESHAYEDKSRGGGYC